uniref:Protein kinase domain-containing protein n=1 Tax=Leersia perrieri TaxID=77586 RepID=A0A0D9XG12_9ORYZ
MSCLGWFRKRRRSSSSKSNKGGSARTTTATTASAVSTSRSDDSGAVRPVSKSAGSTSTTSSGARSITSLYEERGHGQLRDFDYDELQAATNGFSRAQKLGEGGFGSVYKGFVRAATDGAGAGGKGQGDRVAVAVKCLNQRGLQGHKQWLAEVQFLGVLEHPNLVKLLGYCAVDGERGPQRLLVYEYMPNKSLEDHLFVRAYAPLSWNRRLQIILGAAEGLAYLHEGLEVQVIYRDFKASNILLDKDFRAKLSDFGLAREGPTGANTHVSTAVVGTHGYAAPDYIETGHLTAKSDVWSFGVVLYEILTGRRTLDRHRPQGEQKLLEWVSQFAPDSRNFRMIMDPRLRGEYSVKAAREIAKLAESCLLNNAKERPNMSDVVDVLRRAVQSQQPDSPSSGGGGSGKGKSRVDVAPPPPTRRRHPRPRVGSLHGPISGLTNHAGRSAARMLEVEGPMASAVRTIDSSSPQGEVREATRVESWRRRDDLPRLVAAVIDGGHLGGAAAAGISGFFLSGGKEKFQDYLCREGKRLRNQDKALMR